MEEFSRVCEKPKIHYLNSVGMKYNSKIRANSVGLVACLSRKRPNTLKTERLAYGHQLAITSTLDVIMMERHGETRSS